MPDPRAVFLSFATIDPAMSSRRSRDVQSEGVSGTRAVAGLEAAVQDVVGVQTWLDKVDAMPSLGAHEVERSNGPVISDAGERRTGCQTGRRIADDLGWRDDVAGREQLAQGITRAAIVDIELVRGSRAVACIGNLNRAQDPVERAVAGRAIRADPEGVGTAAAGECRMRAGERAENLEEVVARAAVDIESLDAARDDLVQAVEQDRAAVDQELVVAAGSLEDELVLPQPALDVEVGVQTGLGDGHRVTTAAADDIDRQGVDDAGQGDLGAGPGLDGVRRATEDSDLQGVHNAAGGQHDVALRRLERDLALGG